jgi:hypothetical protein
VADERRAQLQALKLQTLVRDHFGAPDGTPLPYPSGAALVRDGEGWVLLEDDPASGLGGALAWAARQDVDHLHVLTESDAGLLTRRAAAFTPAPDVWQIDGRALHQVEPVPRPTPPMLPAAADALRPVIVAAGAEPVEEHGVLGGEVLGLEVCRVVVDDDPLASGGPGARLDVGIGDHDREAFRLVHGDGPVDAALARVVTEVAAHRRPGAPPHALNRLARERALRHRLVADPSLIGLTALAPAPPPVARTNLADAVPCVALGADDSGAPVVVVCSAGVDLDLVPFAAHARDALAGPDTRLLLAVPEGDDHPVTRELAARLAVPAEVVPVPPATPSTAPATRPVRHAGT